MENQEQPASLDASQGGQQPVVEQPPMEQPPQAKSKSRWWKILKIVLVVLAILVLTYPYTSRQAAAIFAKTWFANEYPVVYKVPQPRTVAQDSCNGEEQVFLFDSRPFNIVFDGEPEVREMEKSLVLNVGAKRFFVLKSDVDYLEDFKTPKSEDFEKVKKGLGVEKLDSNYDFWNMVLSMTPKDIPLVFSFGKAVARSVVLMLKPNMILYHDRSMYSFETSDARGFQFGGEGENKPVLLELFVDGDEYGVSLTGFSQDEIDCLISSIKKPASNELAGWQTYRNEEYGFEFMYPPTFLLKEVPEHMYSVEGSKEIIAITDKKQDFQYILRVLPYKDVEILIPSNWSGNSFVYDPEKKDWVIKNLEDDPKQDIYIDKTNSGLKIYILYTHYGDAGSSASIGIIPLPNNLALRLDFSGYKSEIIDQIFSTFKFVETEIEQEQDCENLGLPADTHPADIVRFKIGCYLRAEDEENVKKLFSLSEKTQEVLTGADQESMNRLATWIEDAKLLEEMGDARIYRYTWPPEVHGEEHYSDFTMVKGYGGDWIIASW